MIKLMHGDCLVKMAELETDSVDSIVTDPPAGISFMSKSWDADKGGRMEWIAWMEKIAAECIRVIKPGGHALVWAIPRTSHWTGMAWENAGWVPRDKIYHCFGSGFPKSLDLGKAIDKRGGQSVAWFGPWFRNWREQKGITQKQVAALFPSKTGGQTGCVANWELGFNMPTPEQFNLIRDAFNLPFDDIYEAEREIVGQYATDMGGLGGERLGQAGGNITTPASEAATPWEGWHTALKPSIEEWWLFRKPRIGNVAENVLKHGCGGLNIGACRVGTESITIKGGAGGCVAPWKLTEINEQRTGRYPANLVLTPDEEVLACFPETTQGGAQRNPEKYRDEKLGKSESMFGVKGMNNLYGDSGSAARFFQQCPYTDQDFEDAKRLIYCGKASKQDRDGGLEGMELKPLAYSNQAQAELKRGNQHKGQSGINTTKMRTNFHPCVKPQKLMQYLCKLITLPGGTVLDPFMGSGSTGKAAVKEGFSFIGIEKELEYIRIANARINHAKQSRGLLNYMEGTNA